MSVPAAAVIQGGQVLFYMTGRKGYVGGFLNVKRNSILNLWVFLIYCKTLSLLRITEPTKVTVKCSEIGGNFKWRKQLSY